MKSYLDNAVVSAIGKGDVPTAEVTILDDLLVPFESGRLDLVTSSVTAREIEQYKGAERPDIERVYARLKKVPFIEDHEVVGFHNYWDRFGGESYPFVEDDATSSALRKMGIKRTDAHHLMLAIRSGCARFVTYDRGILSKSSQIEAAFGIKAVRPAELLAEFRALAPSLKPALSPGLFQFGDHRPRAGYILYPYQIMAQPVRIVDKSYVFVDGAYFRKVADEFIGEMFSVPRKSTFGRSGASVRTLSGSSITIA
jgi:predicted nucleic acid-binding protein